MFLKKQRTTSILLLLIVFLSSCQPIQTPTPTLPEPSPSLTNRTQSTKTNTPTIQVTNTPSATPNPDSTKVDIRMMGTPLPTNLAMINTENIKQVQHLASWGTGSPNRIHLSSDGQILAVGTSNGAYFYDSLGLYELAFRETPHSVMSFAFSTDQKFVAVGQFGGVINIFDRFGFTPILQLDAPNLPLHDTYESDLFFSPGNAKLISIIRTNEKIFINHWQTSDWQPVDAFILDNSSISYLNPDVGIIGVIKQGKLVLQSMLFSQESKSLPIPESLSKDFWLQLVENKGTISACGNGEDLLINNGSSIKRWNIPSEKISDKLTEYPISLPGPCQTLAESCLNQNGEPTWVCEEDTIPTIETIALTPDGLMLLISRNDNNVEFRRAFDGLIAWEIETKYTQVRFSPGNEFFFGLQEDGLIEKRSTENGALLGAIDQHPGRMYDIAFSPDGDDIAGGINTGWIQIVDTSDGQIVGVLAGSASVLEYSPDGAFLAAGLLDGRIRIFDLTKGQYFDLPGHQDAIADMAFSSDGKSLLAGSTDCTINLWDLVDRAQIKSIIPDKETPFMVKAVGFSPVEKDQYLIGSHESLFIVSEEIKIPLLPSILLSDLALSQNKQTLAVTGESTYLFRDIDDNAFSESINLSTQGRVLALNGDGTLLILGTRDALEFWSVNKAEKLHAFPLRDPGLPGNQPINLEISPDNTLIGVGYQNGLIDIFGIP
ncbi:MAG: WD40 repeat domain-containing protein [Chloroflexota bacterium]|nr:WD40 repeat domain-containing protein [Chloroflexota bacterium]